MSFHESKDSKNPHVHILLTTRNVGPNGFSEKKNRDWDKRENVILWREEWANIQNRELERKGLVERVSHESYNILNIDREPTKHLGPRVCALERKGIQTYLGDKNRAIKEKNKDREREKQFEKIYSRSR